MSICEIAIDKIVLPWVQLRPVRQDTIEFLEMVDSIRDHGLLNSIAVRPHPSRLDIYELIDGGWRLTACKQAGHYDIPAIVLEDVSDEDVLTLQIQANAVSYETRPIEFANQMLRLIRVRDSIGAPITKKDLASLVSKSSAWVADRLNLLKLHDDLQEEIRQGNMPLGKGVALARINSHEHQLRIWSEHKHLKVRDFELKVGQFIQETIAQLESQKIEDRQEITLRPRIQSMDSMLIELDRLDEISQIIVSRGLTTAYEGAKLAIEWVLNLHEAGRQKQVSEKRFQLSQDERREIIGRQQYEELRLLRELREDRSQSRRENFN